MTHRLHRACAALLSLACLSVPAVAKHDHASQITPEDEFMREAGLSPDMHLPGGTNLSDFAEATRETGPGGNETPGVVRGEIAELKDLKLMNDFLSPAESAGVARQIEAAQVRLVIAEKRQQRDRLRKQKKKVEADRLDREIHGLKAKLNAFQSPGNGIADLFKPDGEASPE